MEMLLCSHEAARWLCHLARCLPVSNRNMRPFFVIAVIFFAVGTMLPQVEKASPGPDQTGWQEVDQLCGQLELSKPSTRIIIVNGKREERSYLSYLSDAKVLLYRGADSDTECCGKSKALEKTTSKRFGAFALPGYEHGLYWLQVRKGSVHGEVPLHVTENSNERKCRAPEVRRSFIVDSKPPSVQVRIR